MIIMTLSYKDLEVREFLATRQMTRELVKQCIAMLPDREFYYPEIECGDLKDYQIDLNNLIGQARQERDVQLYANHDYLRREYDEQLLKLVLLKRHLLTFSILMQDDDKRREILFRLIQENCLQRRVLSLKERFRM